MEHILLISSVLVAFYLAKSLLDLSASDAWDRKQACQGRLGCYLDDGTGGKAVQLIKQQRVSTIPWLRDLLARLNWMDRLTRLHSQASLKAPVSIYIMVSLVFFVAGFMLAHLLVDSWPKRALIGLVPGALPFLYIKVKRDKRMALFERQLPDGLDLIARALKSGHTIPSGMKLVADEFDDPIGTEFGIAQDEISFGLSVQEALENMNARLDSQDLGFFVISVVLQGEAGGNLSELVENISRLIRERFKFRRKVKALTAEGRLSANILMALPLLMLGFKMIKAPDDLPFLLRHDLGKLMLEGAGSMMVFGYLVIKKMVKLDV